MLLTCSKSLSNLVWIIIVSSCLLSCPSPICSHHKVGINLNIFSTLYHSFAENLYWTGAVPMDAFPVTQASVQKSPQRGLPLSSAAGYSVPSLKATDGTYFLHTVSFQRWFICSLAQMYVYSPFSFVTVGIATVSIHCCFTSCILMFVWYKYIKNFHLPQNEYIIISLTNPPYTDNKGICSLYNAKLFCSE